MKSRKRTIGADNDLSLHRTPDGRGMGRDIEVSRLRGQVETLRQQIADLQESKEREFSDIVAERDRLSSRLQQFEEAYADLATVTQHVCERLLNDDGDINGLEGRLVRHGIIEDAQ